VKFYKFYFFLSFTLYLAPALLALPCPLPCPARETNGQTDPALPCKTGKQTDIRTLPCPARQINRRTDGPCPALQDRQIDGQTDPALPYKTDKQTDRRTLPCPARQTNRRTYEPCLALQDRQTDPALPCLAALPPALAPENTARHHRCPIISEETTNDGGFFVFTTYLLLPFGKVTR